MPKSPTWPIVSLLLGFAGACAIIVAGTLLARMQWLNFLRFCGEHSIVIYLAFFLPMAVTRTVLLRYGDLLDIGTIALMVNIAGVVGALAIWQVGAKGRRKLPVRAPRRVLDRPEKAAPRAAGGGVRAHHANRRCPDLVQRVALLRRSRDPGSNVTLLKYWVARISGAITPESGALRCIRGTPNEWQSIPLVDLHPVLHLRILRAKRLRRRRNRQSPDNADAGRARGGRA